MSGLPSPLPAAPSAADWRKVWPHSAQLAGAFLIGAATALLSVYLYSCRWGGRPTELERGAIPLYRVDLNHAPRAELLQLPGIGVALADRLEDYRRVHGGFRDIDDLARVPGFGPATRERLRPWVQASVSDAVPNIQPAKPKARSKKADLLKGPIDINHASQAELQLLPGIGPKMSQRILDERAKMPFRNVDDLRRVAGIGAKTLERLRPYVIVHPDLNRIAARDVAEDD